MPGVYRLSHKDKKLFLGSQPDHGLQYTAPVRNGKCLNSKTALTDKGRQERDWSISIVPECCLGSVIRFIFSFLLEITQFNIKRLTESKRKKI